MIKTTFLSLMTGPDALSCIGVFHFCETRGARVQAPPQYDCSISPGEPNGEMADKKNDVLIFSKTCLRPIQSAAHCESGSAGLVSSAWAFESSDDGRAGQLQYCSAKHFFWLFLIGAHLIFRDSQNFDFGPCNLLPAVRVEQPDWYRS